MRFRLTYEYVNNFINAYYYFFFTYSIRYFFTGNRRPGIRSLPLSPPPRQERPHLLYSCPDGLAHALSEQNMRLHQIVQEHMVSEASEW